MKRKPIYLFLIAALIIAAVVICGKPQIVPVTGDSWHSDEEWQAMKDADTSDTIFIDPLDDGSEIDLREWAITTEDQIEFLDVTPFEIQAKIDTNNVLTIYDPRITVVWDTLK